jgi:hypothetical protein
MTERAFRSETIAMLRNIVANASYAAEKLRRYNPMEDSADDVAWEAVRDIEVDTGAIIESLHRLAETARIERETERWYNRMV